MLGGKYRFSLSLGQFAAVELASALDTTTGRAVTLERLPLTAAVSDAAQLCRDRVAELRKLQHPNLLQVLDSFEHAGALHVVSEPLVGESLAARLTRERVSVSQLSNWLADAMRAVATLHRHGLVLRSISPATIFLTDGAHAEAPTIKIAPLLLAGLCIETVAGANLGYCAMEQLAGATDLDARTDVYAFAAIAFQAFTGKLPFEADSPAATRLRIMTESATPLKRARPELPDELCTLIDLALAKRRQERLGSLDGMLALLEPCTDQLRGRKQPLLTLQLAAAPAHVIAYAPQRPSLAAEQSSLQPVDKPITSLLPQPSAAGAAVRRMLGGRQAPLLALGTLGVALLTSWALWQRDAPSSLATDPLPVPAHTAAHQPSATPVAAAPASTTLPKTASPTAMDARDDLAPDQPDGASGSVLDVSSLPQRVNQSPGSRRSSSAAARRAARAEPTTAPNTRPDCSPNYVFDAQGEKHWKPECF